MEYFVKWRELPMDLVREILYTKYSSNPYKMLKYGFGDLVKPKYIRKAYLDEYFLQYYRDLNYYKKYNNKLKEIDFTYTQFNEKSICMMLDIAIEKLIITPVIINHCILYNPRYLHKMLYHLEYGQKVYNKFISGIVDLIKLCTNLDPDSILNIKISHKILFDFLLNQNSPVIIKKILKHKYVALNRIDSEIFNRIIVNKNISKYHKRDKYNDLDVINILVKRDKIDLLIEYVKLRQMPNNIIIKNVYEFYNPNKYYQYGNQAIKFNDEIKNKFSNLFELNDKLYEQMVKYFNKT